MKTRLNVSGMHCAACAQKIELAVAGVRGVRRADVSLDDASAVIEHDGPIDLDALNDAVGRVGEHRLTSAPNPDAPADAGTASLYPLFLIVGYILGVTLLIAGATDVWSVKVIMRHFMAGFFLVFSFFKLLDLPGFVSAYRGYDIPARLWPAWAWAYPFVELALGVAYLLNLAPLVVNGVTFVVMLVSGAGVLKALLDKRAIRCACLGTALNLPMTTITLVEDFAMAAMAGAMLLLHFL